MNKLPHSPLPIKKSLPETIKWRSLLIRGVSAQNTLIHCTMHEHVHYLILDVFFTNGRIKK